MKLIVSTVWCLVLATGCADECDDVADLPGGGGPVARSCIYQIPSGAEIARLDGHPETEGVRPMLDGIAAQHARDDARVDAASALFDVFVVGTKAQPSRTRGWRADAHARGRRARHSTAPPAIDP